MKKLWLFAICYSLFALSSPTPARAQSNNKAGINLGGIWTEANFAQAADIVGDGGWITVLADACSQTSLEEKIFSQNRNVNLILRLYNGGVVFEPSHAKSYVEMLGKLDTGGKKVYVVPWNEPNMDRESGGHRNPSAVVGFVRELQSQLSSAGLLDSKVYLLSPAFNQSAPNGPSTTTIDGFVAQILAEDPSFWGRFHGVAMNTYQFDSSPLTDKHLGALGYGALLSDLGAAGKDVYFTEFGKVVSGSPSYDDGVMSNLLTQVFPTYNGNSQVKAVTPLAYDPEPVPHNFYLCSVDSCSPTSQTAVALRTSRRAGGTSAAMNDPAVFASWRLANCPSSSCEPSQTGVSCSLGGGRRSCDSPLDGPKDEGCYGVTLKKDSPDETITDPIANLVKTFFHWGGAAKIDISKLTIPVEHDLANLLGVFPHGTPPVVTGDALESFQSGVLPKLTPPGPPLAELHQRLPSYLEDYSRGELAVTSCKTPGSKNPTFSVPDVWGLANTAGSLFSSLAKIPGTGSSSSLDGYRYLLTSGEATSCKSRAGKVSGVANAEKVMPAGTGSEIGGITLAQAGSGSGCYGPGNCPNKTEAPDKEVCLTNESYGQLEPKVEEGSQCPLETRTCTSEDVLNFRPPQPPCPNGPTFLPCTNNDVFTGRIFYCNPPTCGNSQENNLALPPKISFLPEYTQKILDTFAIFKLPGLREKELFGEGQINFTYENVADKDSKILYKKLGTVECLEDYTRRTLLPPGHGLAPKSGCFE